MVCTNLLLFFFFWNNLASRHQQQARRRGFITNSDLFRPLLTGATVMKYRFGEKKKKSWGSRGRGWQRAPNKPTSDTDNLQNVALMTSAEAVNRALRGLCFRLQQRKKNLRGRSRFFLHLANKKIEIVSVSSFFNLILCNIKETATRATDWYHERADGLCWKLRCAPSHTAFYFLLIVMHFAASSFMLLTALLAIRHV